MNRMRLVFAVVASFLYFASCARIRSDEITLTSSLRVVDESTINNDIQLLRSLAIFGEDLRKASIAHVSIDASSLSDEAMLRLRSVLAELDMRYSLVDGGMYQQHAFLDAFEQALTLSENADVKYFLYLSQSSFVLNDEVLMDGPNLTSSVYCDMSTQPLKSSILYLGINIYDLGLPLQVLHLLVQRLGSLGCGCDVFMMSKQHAASVHRRIRELLPRVILAMPARVRSGWNPMKSSFLSQLLLNVALLMEQISALPFPAHEEYPPSLITIPTGAYLIYDISPAGECSVSAGGSGAGRIPSAVLQSIADTPYACDLLSGFKHFVPVADYVEIAGFSTYAQRESYHRGINIVSSGTAPANVLTNALHAQLTLPTIAVGVSENEYDDIHALLTQHLRGRYQFSSFYHIHGEVIADDSYLLDGYVSVELLRLMDILFEGVIASRLPCVLLIEGQLQSPEHLSAYESYIMRLGLLPWSVPGYMMAVGPQCSKNRYLRVLPLLPPAIQDELHSMIHYSPLSAEPPSEFYDWNPYEDLTFSPPHAQFTDKIGDEFAVIEDILPSHVLDFLHGRLFHQREISLGANSYFIPFDEDFVPRSVVEAVIIKLIAPLVVGNTSEARNREGFLGAEWWIQARETSDPKEYHMDTAITWCRDNGWPQELLPSCHFYPAIASVNYITDEGGPTAMFNQSPSELGLSPPVPEEIAVVFPRKGRMSLFKGDRFHGVLKHHRDMSKTRTTLLVNYWKDKTAGEAFTPLLPYEGLYLRYLYNVLLKVSPYRVTPQLTSLDAIELPRDFKEDMMEWQKQNLPDSYWAELHGTTSPKIKYRLKPSVINAFCDSSGESFANWPHWSVHETTGEVTLLKLDADHIKNWRDTMPGGNPYKKG